VRWSSGVLTGLRSEGVPLQPDATTARELARRELAERAYREAEPGLLERAVRALLDGLGRLDAPSGSSPLRAVALVLLLLALAAGVALAVRAVGRTSRTARGRSRPVLGAGAPSAAAHREAADRAAAQGRWEVAVAERFRALVRALQERDLLASSPGLTAAEAAAQAGSALPALAPALHRGAALFDAVAYGGRSAAAEDDAVLRALDADAAAARPQLAAAGPSAGPAAGRGAGPSAGPSAGRGAP